MASDSIPKIQAGNLFRVDGLNVVITGGGSGLGSMMARALAVNGANKVFILGRRSESLQQTAASIPNSSDTIVPIVGDVTSQASLKSAVETVKSYVSHIDVLIANSGIFGPPVALRDRDQKPLPIETIAENIISQNLEEATNTYRVNVVGVQYTIGAFLPLLAAANEARPSPPTAENFKPRPQIITTASIGGYNRVPLGGLCYGPSKAAVLHLTKMLATSLVPYDIRVNGLAPGIYLSEMTENTLKSSGRIEAHNVEGTWPTEMIPATRSGDEEDMAGCILWLCSRAGAYINGNILVTDGGRLSVTPASY